MTEQELQREATEAIDHIVRGAMKTMGAGFRKWAKVMDTVADQVDNAGLLEQASALEAERQALTAELPHAKGLRAAALKLRLAQINAIEAQAVAAAERAMPTAALTHQPEPITPGAGEIVVRTHKRRPPHQNGVHG